MEKATWIKELLDGWVNLSDKKKISYITGLVIIIMGIIIYILVVHYENKITKIENDNIIRETTIRNEYSNTIRINNIRCDSLLSLERKNSEESNKELVKYISEDQKQVREVLFTYEKYKNKRVR